MTNYGYGLGFGLHSGGPRWSPAAIGTNLKMWYKPEDLPASGLVENWPNAAPGRSDILTQSVEASRPVVVASHVDGYSGALFDGVDDYLSMTSPNRVLLANDYEVHYVMTRHAGGANSVLLGEDSATDRPIFVATGGQVWAHTDGGAITISGSAELTADTTYYISAQRNSSDVYTFFRNGTDRTVPATPTSAGNTNCLHLCKRSSDYMNVTMVEALVISAKLSAANFALLTSYFRSRYPTLSIA